MRTYLVVVDGSAEAQAALRFAARRARDTGGGVSIVALAEPTELVPWGGVQAAMEDEAHDRAEALVAAAAGTLLEETGLRPAILVRQGEGPRVIREAIAADPGIAALVLGAAASGPPGPLVAHFAGEAGALPVPLIIVPGGLDRAAIDRLS